MNAARRNIEMMFVDGPAGTIVYYPWGWLGSGYCVPSLEAKEKIIYAKLRYAGLGQLLGTPLAILAYVLVSSQGRQGMLLLILGCLVIMACSLVWSFYVNMRQVGGLTPVRENRAAAIVRLAEKLNKCIPANERNILFGLLCVFLVSGGLLLAFGGMEAKFAGGALIVFLVPSAVRFAGALWLGCSGPAGRLP